MSEWTDVEEVEAFKPILVSWGNKIRNNIYWLKDYVDRAYLVDGTRSMRSDIIPYLNATFNLGSPQAQWKYLYISGSVGEGGIKTSNTSVCENLNADLLDGRHAGNAANQVPVSNTVVCENLNADMVDGKHFKNIVFQDVWSGFNLTTSTYYIPAELEQSVYSATYSAILVKFGSGSTLNLRICFRNFNTNVNHYVTFQYPTANIRLHAFHIVIVNDREWGRYHYVIINYRDTGGNVTYNTYLVEATNYYALLHSIGFFVAEGTFNIHNNIMLTHS